MTTEGEEFIDLSLCTCGDWGCDICDYQREQAVAANPCPACKGSGLNAKGPSRESQPRVWMGEFQADGPSYWWWWETENGMEWLFFKSGLNTCDIFVPGSEPKPTINPADDIDAPMRKCAKVDW